jgi:polyisoprenoid-binding protein YceI
MKKTVGALTALALAACSQQPAEKTKAAEAPAAPAAPTPAKNTAPAGEYKLDKTHASVTFRVDHLGLSRYTARFTDIDGTLQFDPANPAAMRIAASIDTDSLETDFPNDKPDFDAELVGPQWLDAGKFPKITFTSTKVEPTGPSTAKVTGDFTLHGVTRPLTLNVRFNGGYAAGGMDPSGSRIGFSAEGKLKRSDFGVSYGVPAPGTTFGVGDKVEVFIEAEFTQPAPATPKPAG